MGKRPEQRGKWLPLWMVADQVRKESTVVRKIALAELAEGNPRYQRDGEGAHSRIYIHADEVPELKKRWPVSSGLMDSVQPSAR